MILCVFNANRKQREKYNQKDQKSGQEPQRHQGDILYKHGHNQGQKWYEPSRRRRCDEVLASV